MRQKLLLRILVMVLFVSGFFLTLGTKNVYSFVKEADDMELFWRSSTECCICLSSPGETCEISRQCCCNYPPLCESLEWCFLMNCN